MFRITVNIFQVLIQSSNTTSLEDYISFNHIKYPQLYDKSLCNKSFRD